MMKSIYLDDLRTPIDPDWIVVRSYDAFVNAVKEIGLENISLISLDHDLGDTAIEEYYRNTVLNYRINYDNIREMTGFDCAKWLVEHYYDNYNSSGTRAEKKASGILFPRVTVHSANPIGSANIMGYVNNFLKNEGQQMSCVMVKIPHTVE